MSNNIIAATSKRILDLLEPLRPDERQESLGVVGQFYCFSCGHEHPKNGGHCQCQNDE